jgi:KaiC/GvpD/RAD55 family RecA-like ATPase
MSYRGDAASGGRWTTLTWREADERVRDLANGLLARRLQPEDRCALLGGTSVTEAHISSICDSIILLRYVEVYGEMRRALTVLKMRGSAHDKEIREFNIDAGGMHLGRPFRHVTGILAGTPVHISPGNR